MRASRLLEIILLLQSHGQTTAAQLAREVGVTERTIYRDLDELSALGIPVYTQGGPGGGCGLSDHYRTHLIGVSSSDIEVLLMAITPDILAALGLDRKVQTALHKLVATLPSPQRQVAVLSRQHLHLDAAAWFRKAELLPFLSVLQEAVETGQLIQLNYRRSDGEERERTVAPLGLVAKAGVWYMVGMVESALRVYRVSRVLDVTLLHTPFTCPADFDLSSHWAEWCSRYEASLPRYTALLEIEPAVLETLQSSFVPTVVECEAVESESERGDRLTYAVTFETVEAASSWVLSCGTAVKVIAPDELRANVKLQAAQILTFYS